MKIGYKGLDENYCPKSGSQKSKEVPYDITQVYTIDSDKPLKLCTDTGYHYCNELNDVFGYYPLNRNNRYFEIEILGEYLDGGDKSITKSFRFIKELSKQEVTDSLKQSSFSKVLKCVRKIQEEYPLSHVAGSVGLFLHGAWIDRWNGSHKDIDLILPYYMQIAEGTQMKKSGNDFDYCVDYDGFKCDIKIDPKQQYSIIEYEGFKYKVSRLENILEAKIRYALGGDRKHQQDIKNMICK